MPTSSARATNNAPPGAGELDDELGDEELDDELDDEEAASDGEASELVPGRPPARPVQTAAGPKHPMLAPVQNPIGPSQPSAETEEEDTVPQTHFIEPDSAEAATERAQLVGPTPNPVNAPALDDPASIICSVCNNPYGVFRQDPFTGKYVHAAVTDCMLNQRRPNPMLLR